MPKTLRIFLALAALAITAIVAAGCGGTDVPSDSVAKVGDAKITKTRNHEGLSLARQNLPRHKEKEISFVPWLVPASCLRDRILLRAFMFEFCFVPS